MSTPTAAVSSPSMAGEHVLYLCAGEAWCVPFGTGDPARLDVGGGRVRHLLGDPDGDGCVAVVEVDGTTEIRVLAGPDAEPVVAWSGSLRPVPLTWRGRGTVVLGVPEEDGDDAPVTLVELDVHGPHDLHPSALSHLSALDEDSAGHRVAVTAGVHPAHVRGWRGGSRRRLLRDDGGRWTPDPHPWGNPADACLLGGRVFVLDDPDGPLDLYSVPVGGGPVRRHHLARRGRVTSLRRGRDRLVVGVSGDVLTLRPADDAVLEVRGPGGAAATAPAGGPRPWTAEATTRSPWAPAVARVGAGRLVVTTDDDVWALPAEHGWVTHADWTGDGALTAVVRVGGATAVLEVEPATATVRPRALPDAAVVFQADDAAVAATGVVLASAADGVVWVPRTGPVRGLEARPAHRRGAPVVRADGSVVAWTEETELAGAVLRVARTSSGEGATVTVPGAGVRLPVFAADDRLLFVSTPVSPLTGSAAPVREPSVLCAVDPHAVLRAQAGRTGAPPVQVLARGLHDVREVVTDDSGCWVRERSGLVPVPGVGAAGSPRPREARARHRASPDLPAATDVPAPPDRAERTMRRCLDLLAGRSLPRAEGAAFLDRSLDLLRWAARCVGDDELDTALRSALRDLGSSHAALLTSTAASAPGSVAGPSPCPSRVDEARARAAGRLHGRARYLAVPDVAAAGLRAVEALCRSWRGDEPLVLDLRYNRGGPFADHLAALLLHLLTRDAVARPPGTGEHALLRGPRYVDVLVDQHTGSGGEHLAAALAGHPRVLVLGRRTAGAGTGFHRRWSLGDGRSLVLPQYRLGTSRSLGLENRGLDPDRRSEQDLAAGPAHDDALLDLLPLPPPATPDGAHRHPEPAASAPDEGGTHERATAGGRGPREGLRIG
ncbi:S41 family peptidase [Phycicoccus flavus]|uniref:S41 family peptidase n=1 Tax=Phycicoccus flavus TaxID=2502783 RepID=UPI000FEBA7C1|nr:S41 family peptidase [Phycicoccus flavus]NHA66994.1 hypothetical protein [Phycicoccus flavus]